MQDKILRHSRPTNAEKIAYAQFLFLFCYKYRTLKKQELAQKINLLLSNDKSSIDNKIFVKHTDDFNKVDEFLKLGKEKYVSDLDKFMSNKIIDVINNRPDHPCFMSY